MIGRRGAYLLLMAAVHVSIGLSYLTVSHSIMAYGAFGFLNLLGLPLWTLGIPWVLSALPAIWCAFIRLPHTDRQGFQSLIVVQVAWAIIYLLGDLVGTQPHGWFLGVVFAGLAGATYVVSGMLSPSDMPHHGGD